ncbi:MAG: glycosyltransferase family 4 protein [Proteobacteria bacterium]|nr:glycosyltransferase family 4 protein [Pseudomonadota bacterium]MDA1357847.1 glycosyltransferase family 4 protein [Pseudomonadota bacterium]
MNKRIMVFTDSHIQCGVGVNMAALLEALIGCGYSVSCAQRYEDTEYQRRLAALGVQYYWFPRSPDEDIAGFINDHQTPYEIFRQARPDLIYCANGAPAGCYGAVVAARKLNIPFVISEGLIAEQFLGGNDAERAALKRHYLAARAVIAISQENLDFLRTRLGLPTDLGHVIPNSAADTYFEPMDKAVRAARRGQLGVSDADILCFTAAGLRPVKGYAQQIQALHYLEKHALFARLKFAWAGDGPLREFLEQQTAKHGFTNQIHFLGHSWEVAKWLDAADIFILPSLGEGMPAVVLEAMAKGLPVIATSAGGTPEALGDCGHLLPQIEDDNSRARALAAAILDWADNPEARRRAGARGRARAQAKFTRNQMLGAYLDLIGQSLAAG